MPLTSPLMFMLQGTNGVALVDACGISHTIWIVLSSLVGDDNSFLFSFLLAFQDKFSKTERTQKPK